MPTFNITTNVALDAAASRDFCKAVSDAVVQSVGKPEQWVMVSVRAGTPMLYAGTDEPAAFGELIAIGAIAPIGGENNKKISQKLSEVLKTHIKVDPSRFNIRFVDSAASDYGWNGSTFDGVKIE